MSDLQYTLCTKARITTIILGVIATIGMIGYARDLAEHNRSHPYGWMVVGRQWTAAEGPSKRKYEIQPHHGWRDAGFEIAVNYGRLYEDVDGNGENVRQWLQENGDCFCRGDWWFTTNRLVEVKKVLYIQELMCAACNEVFETTNTCWEVVKEIPADLNL